MEQSKRPIRIFRTVVQRIMRINKNLGKFADAFEIIESLKKVNKMSNLAYIFISTFNKFVFLILFHNYPNFADLPYSY